MRHGLPFVFIRLFILDYTEQGAVPQRLQRLQHVPEPRARVRLPEESGDRGEDQQDPLATTEERSAVSAVHKR